MLKINHNNCLGTVLTAHGHGHDRSWTQPQSPAYLAAAEGEPRQVFSKPSWVGLSTSRGQRLGYSYPSVLG